MGLCLGRPVKPNDQKAEIDSLNRRLPSAGKDEESPGYPVMHSPMPQEDSLNTSSIFVFPQITEEVQEQWKVRGCASCGDPRTGSVLWIKTGAPHQSGGPRGMMLMCMCTFSPFHGPHHRRRTLASGLQ